MRSTSSRTARRFCWMCFIESIDRAAIRRFLTSAGGVLVRLYLLSALLLSVFAAVGATQTPVDGVLRDSAGTPLAEIEIQLQRQDSAVQKANSDAEGKFHFSA